MQRSWWMMAVAVLLGEMCPVRGHTLCVETTLDQDVERAVIIFAGTVARVSCERIPGTIVTRYLFTDVVYAKGSGSSDSLVLTSPGGSDEHGGIGVEETKTFELGKRYVTLATWAVNYIDLAKGYSPLICAADPFVVKPDFGSSSPFVHDGTRGWPLVAFRDQVMVIRNAEAWAPNSNVVDFDAAGHVVPQEPPDLTLWTWARRDTTLTSWEQVARTKAAAAGAMPPNHIRIEVIYRQRDPGTRVTEAEFLDQIRAIVREQAAAKIRDTNLRDARPSGTGPPSAEPTPPQPPVRERAVPGAK